MGEDTYNLVLYHRCIRLHLDSGGNLEADVKVNSFLCQGEELLELLRGEAKLLPNSRRGGKFSLLCSYYLLLSLLLEFPSLSQQPLLEEQEEQARRLLKDLGEISLCGRLLE